MPLKFIARHREIIHGMSCHDIRLLIQLMHKYSQQYHRCLIAEKLLQMIDKKRYDNQSDVGMIERL